MKWLDTAGHYDRLIDMDNDPARDPEPLRAYMDKWDGEAFLDRLRLDKTKSVLEIGVGSGRLAVRIAPESGCFCGIDLSAKSIDRARENLAMQDNVQLICGDFLMHVFDEQFDVICSSLTLMHIRDKQRAAGKMASLLNPGGRAVISLDRNQQECIDMGGYRVRIYPDDPEKWAAWLKAAGLVVEESFETEFAHILAARR